MPDDNSPNAFPGRAAPAAPPQVGAEPGPEPAKTPQKGRRRRLFALLGVAIAIAALCWGAWWLLVGSHYVSTDDAYVGAEVAMITPQVSGQIAAVQVQDTHAVRKGDVLVTIDPADAELAYEQAAADYGRAIRRVRQYLAEDRTAAAQVSARGADIARAAAAVTAAQSDVQRSGIDLRRRRALSASGAVSGEELTTARNASQTAVANLSAAKAQLAAAKAAEAQARGQLAASQALTAGADVTTNPEVLAAKAALDAAKLNLSRTVIRAPIDGVVARRQVQVGQRVAVGSTLMTVVPVAEVYVDANFKEVQLRKVAIGQPATLTADRYGGHVVYHGRVQGLAGGTGSAFAVIPAQNATGNWIKVVQRLPVRIALDPRELRGHPLRVGLSMTVKIDISARPDVRR